MSTLIPKLNSVLLYLLIFTLIGGSYLVVCYAGGIEFSAYRFVLVLSVFYLLITKQFKCYTNRFSKYVFFVFLIWIFYGSISLFWAPELISGIQELFYLGVGFTTYLVFLSLANSRNKFEITLERIWTAGFVIVSVFLIVEMLTQRHLEGEFLQKLVELGDFHKANFIPIFTFINQNILGIYLCISILFAGYFLLQNRNKLLNSLIILVALDFLLFTESRLGILCVILLTGVNLLLFVFKNIRQKIPLTYSWKQLILLLILLGFNVWVVRLELRFLESNSKLKFYNNTNTEFFSAIRSEKMDGPVRKNERVLLLSDSINQTAQSFGTDMVFAIEQHAYCKLLEGNRVKLRLKKVSPYLQRSIFMEGNQLLMLLLIILISGLVSVYLISYQSGMINRAFVFLGSGLFFIAFLSRHSFTYPTKDYKSRILVESDFDIKKLELKDLGVISVFSVTGNQLKSGNETETFLSSSGRYAAATDFIPEKLSSNQIRKNLVLNGLIYLKSSHYMGLGAGGFRVNNAKKMNKYPDGGVGGAHNFIIEILSQYGVVILSLLLSAFVWIGVILVRAFRNKTWKEQHFLVFWSAITLIFMGNANSTFLSLPINWFLVALVLIVANELVQPGKQNEIQH